MISYDHHCINWTPTYYIFGSSTLGTDVPSTQSSLDQVSNSWPPDHDSTFHVIAKPCSNHLGTHLASSGNQTLHLLALNLPHYPLSPVQMICPTLYPWLYLAQNQALEHETEITLSE